MAGTKGTGIRRGTMLGCLFAGLAVTDGGIYAPAFRARTTSVIEASVPTFPGKTM